MALWMYSSYFVYKSLIFLCFSCVCFTHDAYQEDKEALNTIDISRYKIAYINATDTKVYIDYTNDVIKGFLGEGNEWEKDIRLSIEKYVKPGSVAIDIGSHIGVHSMNMAKAVGPNGKVVAFEPQKKLYAEQTHNLKLNNLQSIVELRRQVLGECEKIIQMNPRNPTNEGNLAIGNGGDSAQMITLDSLLLENVSFIKIDVEGYEANVLRGAKETIAKNRPTIILENWPFAAGYHRVFEILEDYGYSYTKFSHCDYLAVPKDIAN